MDREWNEKGKKNRTVRGVITVEMTYILPIIFSIFIMIIYTVFYYHDKNILIGAAGETAVVAAQIARKPETEAKEDFAEFCKGRIRGKLILFSEWKVSIDETDKRIQVSAYAQRGKMRLQVVQSAVILKPEKTIRKKQVLEAVGNSIKSKSEIEPEGE